MEIFLENGAHYDFYFQWRFDIPVEKSSLFQITHISECISVLNKIQNEMIVKRLYYEQKKVDKSHNASTMS